MKTSLFRYTLFAALSAFLAAPVSLYASPIFSEDLNEGPVGWPTQLQLVDYKVRNNVISNAMRNAGGDTDIGALLDNMSVSTSTHASPSTVPEPGTPGLMTIGLLGGVFVVHKKFQA